MGGAKFFKRIQTTNGCHLYNTGWHPFVLPSSKYVPRILGTYQSECGVFISKEI